MKAVNGPAVWGPLMEIMSAVYGPRVILAGGAVRDYILKGETYAPKDFDFFVESADELDLEMSVPELTANGLFYASLMAYDKNDYHPSEGAESNVVAVLEAYLDEDFGAGVNVIGKRAAAIDDVSVLMSDFDHSLCQAYVNSDGEIVQTDDFKKTLDTKIIQRYNDDDRTSRRLTKLLETYPDFRLSKNFKQVILDKKAEIAKRFKPADAKPWEVNPAAEILFEPRPAQVAFDWEAHQALFNQVLAQQQRIAEPGWLHLDEAGAGWHIER